MSVSLAYKSELTATETLTIPDASTPQTIKHDGFNTNKSLTGTTVPPVSQMASFNKALIAGAGTIDLTALPGSQGNVSLNGLKALAVKFIAPDTNANPITVSQGAANGYLLLGANFSMPIFPGNEITLYVPAGTPAVDGTHKNIDLAGTGTQSLNIEIVGG